jgi:DNA-binding FadR family transcriptional regulator
MLATAETFSGEIIDGSPVSPGDWNAVQAALQLPILLDAALRRKSSDIGTLNVALLRMADAAHDPRRYLREVRLLHERIAGISTNRVLVKLYRLVLDAAEQVRFTGDVERHLLVHQHIVDAIVDGSPELVRRAAKEHRNLCRTIAKSERPAWA